MKARRILSLIANSIAVICALLGLFFIDNPTPITYVKYFTIVTNILIIGAGLVSIGYSVEYLTRKNKENKLNTPLFVFKLVTGVSALITFLTVVSYLQYTPFLANLTVKDNLFWNNIFHHYVAPLSFVLGLIFLDLDKKYNFKMTYFGILALAVYAAYILPICLIKPDIIQGAPYEFIDKAKMPLWGFPLIGLLFLVISYGVSVLLWALNRICYLIFVGEEISLKEEETSEEKVLEEKIHITEEDTEEVEKVIKSGYKGSKIYHISKREDKKWQVKFANGQRAIKLFDTQAEAIVFAKKLAKSQGGSIRVHSLKGKIRKAK